MFDRDAERGARSRSLVAAAVTTQAVLFGLTWAAGVPTLYLLLALVSAGLMARRFDEGAFGVAAASLGTVLVLLVGMPLLLFILRQDPGLVLEKAQSSAVHRMLYLSLYGPLLSAVVCLAFGVPLAYLLARGFRGQTLVESLVDLPLVIPHSVAGIVVLFGFGRQGLFPGISLLSTLVGFVVALVFVSAPFAVNQAREAFESVDDRVVYASRVHGASPFETFRRVVLPLAGRGVLTGGVLAWARGVSEFGAVAVVAYTVYFFYPPAGGVVAGQHAPVYIFNTFTSAGLAESGAVATLLVALSAGIFLLVRWLAYDETGGVL